MFYFIFLSGKDKLDSYLSEKGVDEQSNSSSMEEKDHSYNQNKITQIKVPHIKFNKYVVSGNNYNYYVNF